MKRLSLPIPPALHQRLKLAAVQRGEPMAALVLRGIGRELHTLERPPRPPAKPE